MRYDQQLLTEFFTKVGEDYHCVNSGGCGVFALAISRALNKIGFKHEVVFLAHGETIDSLRSNYGKGHKAIRKAIDNGQRYLVPNQHVVIKIGNSYWDTDGKYKAYGSDKEVKSDLLTLAKTVRTPIWNRTFERNNRSFKYTELKKKTLTLAKEYANMLLLNQQHVVASVTAKRNQRKGN